MIGVMRLLHFEQSDQLVLTDFSGKIIPPYAILSHRWGTSEVSFEDLGRGDYKQKSGYYKIRFCAKRAAVDRLKYFWIDTCCIDRWNRRELSRAINSMFRWYENATRCYVLLSDVPVSSMGESHEQYMWEASIRASEWFTRGWTLQELLAPASVEFFSRTGRRLGDKRSLQNLIHDITTIPVDALEKCHLSTFTISERMAWAKNRQTTESEDNVYCLLGILGVFMPASYGEGEEEAWRRLRIEVKVASNAPSIIPFSQNGKFIGYESQLVKMEESLFGNKEGQTMAILGPGGIGKSQLALEFAYRTRHRDNSCSVFWIDASDLDAIYQGYESISQKLHIPGWNDEKVDVKELVKAHLSGEDVGPWLLVLDNVDDVVMGPTGLSLLQATNFTDLLPRSKQGVTIFTTTNGDIAKNLAFNNIVELKSVVPETALRIFENYIQISLSRDEEQEATLLLQELLHFPIAIIQAAAYMKTQNITLKNYRLLLAAQGQNSQGHVYIEDGSESNNIKSPVARTLLLSMDQISSNSPLAAGYMCLAACVNRKDVPFDVLEASSDSERADAMKVLNSYALITSRPAESALDIHKLVHCALRDWLHENGKLDQWTKAAIKRLLGVFPDHNHNNRSKWRRLLPHSQYVLSHSALTDMDTETINLIWKCARSLNSEGRYNESEKLFMKIVDTSEKTLGDEHPSTLTSMASLASTLWNQGRWKEAEELEASVMEIRKRTLGDENPSTLISMANLAATYRSQGRWNEAEELELRVVSVRRKALGDEHPSTLTSMANLATTYRNQGRWIEAEELEVPVMKIRKKTLGSEHPDTLASMANLAGTYRSQGRWKEAEILELPVMKIRKRTLGDEHPSTLTSMASLAATYRSQGRWKESEELRVPVMEIRKRTLGEEHPSTLTSMASLAATYRSQGRWKESEELRVQVMNIRRRTLGDEHPSTLTSMANLAGTYRIQGRWKQAEDLEVLVMEVRKRTLGNEHPSTLTSMTSLAGTYRSQGRWKEAEDLELPVMEVRKKTLGHEHPSTLTSMAGLAATYRNQGRWKEAEDLEFPVKEIRNRTLGDEHPDTLVSIASLAATYKSQGRWKEAEVLEIYVMDIRKRILGHEHPDTLASIASLAETYRNQGQQKEAEALELPVVEKRRRILGDEHPDTLTSIASLAATYKSQGRWEEAEVLEISVMEIRKRTLGDEHPDTLASMASLALTFWNQDRWKEAEEIQVRGLRTCSRVLGDDHPSTLIGMRNLALTLNSQHRCEEASSLMERCIQLQQRILGDHHPDTESSLETLVKWKMQKMHIENESCNCR